MYERFKFPLRSVAACLAIVAAVWALLIWLLGGVRTSFVTASSPWRALLVAAAAAVAYAAITGPGEVRRDIGRHSRRFITPLALMLALAPAIAGLARNSWTAGGADAALAASMHTHVCKARAQGLG